MKAVAAVDTDLLRAVAENVRRKILTENWDYCCAIDGPEGVGKSSLGLKFARFLDPDWSVDNVAYSADDLLKLLPHAKRGTPLLFDEAANGAYNREAMTKTNRALNTAAMVCRARNLALIMVIPNFWNLDGYFRNHRSRGWFSVERRGLALIHLPSRNRYDQTVFWKPTFRYEYEELAPDFYALYEKGKNAHIAAKLKAGDKDGDIDDEDAEGQRLKDLAEEIASAPEFWKGGRPSALAVEMKYGLTERQARKACAFAKLIRTSA